MPGSPAAWSPDGSTHGGLPATAEVSRTVTLVVGELCANAVRHGGARGGAPGSGFGLRLLADSATVRVEVANVRGGGLPRLPDGAPDADAECGRGLFLVDALASRWGSARRRTAGKAV